MNKHTLSIIIPTRNRQEYCLFTIKQILSHNWDNVEICIQDNSNDNSLEEEILSMGCDSIIYNYHPGELSFVANFNEAVSLSHGEYLCMIGDDDGILTDIMIAVDDMIEQNADASIPELNCIYFWPSNQHIIEEGETGVLVTHSISKETHCAGKVVNHKDAVKKLLQNGIQNYTNLDLPRLYHGIVRRNILENIKNIVGFYFGGLTPDMYMAIALSLTCKKVIRVQYSITISGICSRSGSSDSATGKHTGDLSAAPHFRGHSNYKWDPLVPAFYSVDTIWADTLFHALRDFKQERLIEFYNLPLFSSICMKRYPRYSELILRHAIEHGCLVRTIKVASLKYRIACIVKRINGWVSRLLSLDVKTSTSKLYHIQDIIQAEKAINVLRKNE